MTDHRPEDYRYSGARALVELHERHLRDFVAVWRKAREGGLELPPSADADTSALSHMLLHVLSAARGYLTWCCEVLDLEEPGLPETPALEAIEEALDEHLERLLSGWRSSPLAGVEERRFYVPTHASRWKVHYCVDAMLEHAVMHPVRHAHQLRRLMG